MEYIDIKPFGKVLKDRFELSLKYKLLRNFDGMWITTRKCIDNYQKYGEYLRGWIDKPEKRKEVQYLFATPEKKEINEGYYTSPKKRRKNQIDELLLL